MPFLYSIFGLQLYSNRPIPALIASPATVEVDIWVDLAGPRLNDVSEAPLQRFYVSPDRDGGGQPVLTVWKPANGAYFRLCYIDGTEFLVDRRGTCIQAAWPDAVTLDDTLTYLLGPVLGFVLRLRGITCLHASAVVIDDHAIAFVGPAGAGKSTTGAAFAGRGYAVLSDDIVALWDQNNTFLVQPAYPRVHLWLASVQALYGPLDALSRLTPTWEKRYLDLTLNGYRFQRQALPLAAIYILDKRCPNPATPFVEALPAHAGLITLIANTYASSLLDHAMRAQEFELLSRLAARVPVRWVHPHANPAHLSGLLDSILDDFQTLTPLTRALTEPRQG